MFIKCIRKLTNAPPLVSASDGVADVLLVMLILAAGLESLLAFCVGCRIFALLMRAGLIPEAVCAECADIWAPGRRTARTGA